MYPACVDKPDRHTKHHLYVLQKLLEATNKIYIKKEQNCKVVAHQRTTNIPSYSQLARQRARPHRVHVTLPPGYALV